VFDFGTNMQSGIYDIMASTPQALTCTIHMLTISRDRVYMYLPLRPPVTFAATLDAFQLSQHTHTGCTFA
jgi:hypothetical protein